MDRRDYRFHLRAKFSMPRIAILLPILVVSWSFAACWAYGQTISVQVTIYSVKPEAKEVTVEYKTKQGDKKITLDVSRKAEIRVNGEESTLDSLGPGQKARVEYHRELEIVTKIDAAGNLPTPPRLVEVTELDQPFAFCLSEGGMTIYYERRNNQESTIYTARRNDADSFFEDETPLFPGWFPAVTGDGLEMILLRRSPSNTFAFFSTTRDTLNESFRRPEPVVELRDPPEAAAEKFAFSKNPSFSADGLTLYFNRYPGNELVFATRPDRKSEWNKPQLLKLAGANLLQNLMCPFVAPDGGTLFCVIETPEMWVSERGNLLKFRRATPEGAFGDPEFVEIDGAAKLIGRWPRYVSATNELFFLQADEAERFRKSRLVVIKNYLP
ncbi:MAG: hypothetical protein KY475_04755 [Planctomycetes bacterium]|nr:hypothetical protein [Planctomycetota bacterium]